MLVIASALKGYAIQANDGRIGTVSDLLFDDKTWQVRWLVADTGTWLSGRKVLIHPSAIRRADYERQELPVALTKAQVEGSPSLLQDQPVSRQMQNNLYDYYGWDSSWGGSYLGMGGMGMGAIASPLASPPYRGGAAVIEADRERPMAGNGAGDGDPHLRSLAEVVGYHVHATDGVIGHIEDVRIDDAGWDIRYLVIDTRNWWPGRHVLMAPYAVREIRWSDREVRLDVTRDQVKASPLWDPLAAFDHAYEGQLHGYYGWPGYGL